MFHDDIIFLDEIPILEAKIKEGKTKYKCPFCGYRGTKVQLVSHVDKVHTDMIPEGYTAARVVFNHINKKERGYCTACKKETKWNEDTWRYDRICDDPLCKEELRNRAKDNMRKEYGTETLLNDPYHQEKMLRGRSISGTYKFQNGKSLDYVGSYEKKCLEFMDKVLNIDPDDLMVPGPVIYYTYNKKEHFYISDMYYIPANLVIEVKDGGDNPNNKYDVKYRDRQKAKDLAVIESGQYNYLKLTNNNFDQLLEILALIKYDMLPETRGIVSVDNKIYKINEEVGGIPPAGAGKVYVISYGYGNVFNDDVEGYGVTDDITSDNMCIVQDKKIKKVKTKDFLEDRKFDIREYCHEEVISLYSLLYDTYKNKTTVNEDFLYETFVYNKELNQINLENYNSNTIRDLVYNEGMKTVLSAKNLMDSITTIMKDLKGG